MNKEEYLQNKLKQKTELEEKFSKYSKKCLRCLRPLSSCFCSAITQIETNCRIIILMHPKEARKQRIGTGRLAHLALKNSEIIIGESFDNNIRVQELLSFQSSENIFPMILYPGETSHNISHAPITVQPNDKSASVLQYIFFVIDGTWPCAKSMMRDSKILHSIPRISFELIESSRFTIKHQPASYCLSTIESIYYLLCGLDKWNHEKLENQHSTLLKLLDKLVAHQINCANDPNLSSYRLKRGYKSVKERVPSAKWKHRKICY